MRYLAILAALLLGAASLSAESTDDAVKLGDKRMQSAEKGVSLRNLPEE